MRSAKLPCLVCSAVLALAALHAKALPAAEPPLEAVGVSPGGMEGTWEQASSCPTFSWGLLLTPEVELAIYEVDPSDSSVSHEPRTVRLPGTVTSWTPTGSTCLEAGARYAWSVRGTGVGRGGSIDTGWSEPRTFEVRSAPTADEIAKALETLRRANALRDPAAPSLAAGSREPSAYPAARSPRTRTPGASRLTPPSQSMLHAETANSSWAAVHGENTSDSGWAGYFAGEVGVSGNVAVDGRLTLDKTFDTFELGGAIQVTATGGVLGSAVKGVHDQAEGQLAFGATGVFGTSSSTNGVGVVGTNSAGGKAGKFFGAVEVDGGLGVTGAIDVGGRIDVNGGMSVAQELAVSGTLFATGLDCLGCVGTTDILDNSIHSSKIPNQGIWSQHIEDGAVTNPKIADRVVTTRTLEQKAVTPDKLADGLYRTKRDLYLRTATRNLAFAEADDEIEVFCDEREHLALVGFCQASSSRVRIFESAAVGSWTSDALAAGWRCQGRNLCGTNIGGFPECQPDISVGVICVEP